MFDIFIKASLIIHVFAGTCALLTGLLAIIFKSQTPTHKKIGKLYFWFMTVVFITGFYLSLIRTNLFLFYISIFSYYMVVVAYRALKYKQPRPIEKLDWIIQIVSAVAFLALIIFSVLLFLNPKSTFAAIIPFTFGGIGLYLVFRNVQRFKAGPKEKLEWKKVHIGHMIGSYIAAITAFLVNQSEYIAVHPVILWLGPTVILVPLISMEIKKVKKIPLP